MSHGAGEFVPANVSSRSVGLDVLRFLAVSLVLYIHALQVFGPIHSGGSSGLLERILSLIPPGMRGVDIFFVLSGFLVSGLFFQELARTGTVSPGRFLIRRGFKIYPGFWLLIAVTVLLAWAKTGGVNVRGLLAEIFFYQNYVMGLWYHTWTLAVEEHFYLILAGVFFVLKRLAGPGGKLNLAILPRVADAAILACFGARVLTWWLCPAIDGDNARWFGSVTHVRIDALFFGLWLAYLWHHQWDEARRVRVVRYWWFWLAAGWMLISPLSDRLLSLAAWHVFGFMLNFLGAGCLLLAALALDRVRRPAGVRVFAWFGRHSYSVYLWHMLVLEGVRPVLGMGSAGAGSFLAKAFLYFAASWFFGIILARMVEIPMLRLRDRLFPAKERQALNEQNPVS